MHRSHGIYLFATSALIVMLTALAFVFVSAVDPLFLLKGNQLSERNYIFNERISKVAFYANRESAIDCIILGSSRMTYLDGRALGGCANFAFSGALPSELVLYAEYLHATGLRPSRVIVGVDRFGSVSGDNELPTFVTNKQPIGHVSDYYLSLDLLTFSIKNALGFTNTPNFYDHDLRKHIDFSLIPTERHLNVPFYVTSDDLMISGFPELGHYQRLRSVFPTATYVGLVPPISTTAWVELSNPQVRSRYVAGVLTYASVFDEFYDLSRLDAPCADTIYSYDGTHFAAELWDHLAEKISRGAKSVAIRSTQTWLDPNELDDRYKSAANALQSMTCPAQSLELVNRSALAQRVHPKRGQ